MAGTIGTGVGLELNAEAVMSMFGFMNTTAQKHRVFTSEDVVKESEKIRGNARVQMSNNREVDSLVGEQRNTDERRFGKGNVVSSTAGSDPTMLRAHNFAPVFLR